MFNQQRIYRVFQLITALKRSPHKSIKDLSLLLETSERTTYRYLDLLSELSFDIDKDNNGFFFISNEYDDSIETFSQEETEYLQSILDHESTSDPIVASVKLKIGLNSTSHLATKNLNNIRLKKNFDTLKLAISSKTPVCLDGYHSFNSNTIANRTVEPFGFTPDLKNLIAFEAEKNENKYFRLERIEKVELLTGSFKHDSKHELQESDVFGYAFTGDEYPIHYQVSVRGYIYLIEQFPSIQSYITKKKRAKNYELKVTIANMDPVYRIEKSLDAEDLINLAPNF